MSELQGYESPQHPAQPQKSGGGGARIFLIVAGVIVGLSLLCCCGGFAGFTWWANNAFTQDPTKVVEISDQIVDVTPPEDFRPIMGGDFFGVVRMAIYAVGDSPENADPNQMMFVMDMQAEDKMLDNPEGFKQQMRQQMNQQQQQQQQGKNQEPLNRIGEPEEREIEVNGRKAFFSISEAEGAESGDKYFEVIGVFKGKERPGFIYLRAKQDTVDRAEIDAMIDSMKN